MNGNDQNIAIDNSADLTPMRRFWRLLKPDQREIRNVYIYAIFNGLIGLSLPLGIQAIVNLIQGGQVSTSWIVLVIFVVLGVAVTGILQIFQLRITEHLQQRIFTRAALEFAYRIPRIKREALFNYHAPELMNRFFDTISVQKGLSKILIDFSAATLQVVFGLLLLSLYHPFFIIFSLVLVLLVFIIFNFTAKKGLDTSLKESQHKYEVAHWLEELARTSFTFKLAGSTDLPMERADKEIGKYLSSRESHFKILVNQYSLMVLFKVIVATGLLALGGILVMEQLMNIGQFIAAEIIVLLIMNSVEKLIRSLETIYDVLTSLAKIGQVTDLELDRLAGENLEQLCSEEGLKIDMKDLSFQYPQSDGYCLSDLNLQILPGQKLVLDGPTASGKSTLLNLLAGMYHPQKGSIQFQGINIHSLDPESIQNSIGEVFGDESIFDGSILENIHLGRKAVDIQAVKYAIEHLGLDGFIQSLPDGLETKLLPEGQNIPKSMAQKILLARAIVHRPKLLLIQDVFENLEVAEKRKLIDFLFSKEQGWTLVCATNDPYVKEKADRIISLDQGRMNDERTGIKKPE